jgi:hypothetical protein
MTLSLCWNTRESKRGVAHGFGVVLFFVYFYSTQSFSLIHYLKDTVISMID